MIELRPFSGLGSANHGWLDARHHFSFGSYLNRARMDWGALRVWNDDTIAPGTGFPMHSHADMEIITYVREGAITHRDSLGNHGVTGAVEVQVMSAGTGITHAEYNTNGEPTRLFQIWIHPDRKGEAPAWSTRPFPKDPNRPIQVLASGLPEDVDALPIRATARVLGGQLSAGAAFEHHLVTGRVAYLVAASGKIRVNGVQAGPRDGIAVRQEDLIHIEALEDAELVLVECLA